MKTRVSIINYSNTIPFTYGLLNSKNLLDLADFSYGYPAQVADMLCQNQVDMSIISVGAIPTIPNAQIVTNYCISATQKVDSVLVCSNKPLDEVSTITLDYQSRTTIIGERALNNASNFLHVYDLANEWYKAFHLPFVFAAWVANKKLSDVFVNEFEAACKFGVENIEDAIAFINKSFSFDIRDYLHNSVEYELSDEKRTSMELYFEKARAMKIL